MWRNGTPGDVFGGEMVLLRTCSVARWYSWGCVVWRDSTPGDVLCGEIVLLGMCSVARWYS